jgi:hypothetical protein
MDGMTRARKVQIPYLWRDRFIDAEFSTACEEPQSGERWLKRAPRLACQPRASPSGKAGRASH